MTHFLTRFKQSIKFTVLTLTTLSLMSFTLPSCPGQKEMQEQLDALQLKATQMSKSFMDSQSSVKTMREEMEQMKTLVSQVSTTVLEQKSKIEELQAKLAEVETLAKNPPKLLAPPKAATKAPIKKRR